MADTTRQPDVTSPRDPDAGGAGNADRDLENKTRDDKARDDGTTGDRDLDSPTDLPKESLVAVVKRSAREFKRDVLTDLAAGLTYYALLSVVPALVVLFSVLGLLGPSSAQAVVTQAEQLVPGSASDVVRTLVQQAQANKGGAGFAAVIALAVALWSASGYVAAFMRASNVIYDIPEGRPIWKTLPIRLGVTLLSLIVLSVGTAIVVLSGPIAHRVGDLIGLGDTAVLVWNIVKWPVLLVLVSVLLAVLYWAAPNARQGGIRWVSPGGVIAVLLWILVSVLFSLYVAFASSYAETYGALAGVIIFMVWLWLTNIAILLGAEINAELNRGRAIAGGMPEDLEPFAEPRDTRKMDERDRRGIEEVRRRLDEK